MVSTQYASGGHETGFHCLERTAGRDAMDGRVLKLEDLPLEFEREFLRNNSYGKARLRASNISRSHDTILFTEDTSWSISGIEKREGNQP
jgi:hypothetical protein